MLTSILSTIFIASLGFVVGIFVSADSSNVHNIHTFEQKIDLLTRENETLQEANEEWSEEYNKLSKEHTLAMNNLNETGAVFSPVVAVLIAMIVANAISIYISLLFKANL